MKRVLGLVAVSALFVSAIAFQGGPAPKASVKLTKQASKPGETLKATVMLTFADGYHGYQNPPSDEFQKPVSVAIVGKDFKLTPVKYPVGSDYKMEGEAKPYKIYKGAVSIPIEFLAPKKAGTYDLKLEISYQQCTDRDCYPPSTVKTSLKVKVG